MEKSYLKTRYRSWPVS